MKKIVQVFWLLFSTVKIRHSMWQKNELGHILGDIFRKLVWSPWKGARKQMQIRQGGMRQLRLTCPVIDAKVIKSLFLGKF
jgi:hypothetical protein